MTDAEKTEFITAQVEGQLNECQYYLKHSFDKNSAIVTLHNLTFGLVSAVVVSQIGSHQQQQQSQQKNRSINKLTNRMLHTTKSASESRIVLRVVYEFITWTPRIYVLTWILTGCACLLCGTIWGAEYSGPLYVNGQAWLGIAITTVYLFFGVQEIAKENNDTKKEKDITSSAFIQTATSRSRFGEEKDDNDEEEGTLYRIGTKSNDKRNDADADDFSRSSSSKKSRFSFLEFLFEISDTIDFVIESILQALLVAATSEHITLGGVFFILRRQPDALKKLLLSCASGNNDSTKPTSMRRNSEETEGTSSSAASLLSLKKIKRNYGSYIRPFNKNVLIQVIILISNEFSTR
ncbi:hypothetical protein FRACYDRAFT_258704 [Fragilariopsis cylindrus CCMP1102]|uniref:Uncharacterized protein n=1 Tax=Fragilariopsis cylindrus CCMP1102 TaxID=635003 RepID=A0A1E7EIG0_9STRA|nr:hypothetical protein FRACYDRAFT_258704 [Fragilariopsis cylindrus CCMP1102]|eukprot:OEU05672.1 hypothetical protein FRACYDRAFT_258704 [Fragilariopsis cylindrus CCMP1102]